MGCPKIEIGDVTTERDWLFVKDTARAFLACAFDGVLGETYNAGSGGKYTVAQMIASVLRITGRDKAIESKQDRMRPDKSEVRVLQADSTKLHAATKWSPAYDFERGLAETVEWWKTRDVSALSKGYRV